ELLLKTAEVTSAVDPSRAVDFLDANVSPAGAADELLRIWIESAGRAGRADRVLAICQEANRRASTAAWSHRWEADAYLRLDRPADAVAALGPLRPATTTDPVVARLHTLALARSGATDQAARFIADLLDRSAAAPVAVA